MKPLNRLSGLDVSFVSLVNRAAVRDPSNPSEPMRFALTKSEIPIVDMTAGATTTKGGPMPATEAELRDALQKAEQENKQLRKDIKKAARKAKKPKPTAANPDPDHDGDNDLTAAGDTDHDYHPASKGDAKMSKSDREELTKAEERIQKAEERAKAAEKIAKQERDLRVRGEFVELAKTELPHLGNSDELGAELHRLSEVLSKDEFDKHLERQRAANEQISKGDLFSQFGRDGSPDPSTAGDLDKVRKQAAEIRKNDPGLSEFDAMAKAINANPELVLNNR